MTGLVFNKSICLVKNKLRDVQVYDLDLCKQKDFSKTTLANVGKS